MQIDVAKGAGAYVSDIDLNSPGSDDIQAIREALGQHGVLFFRNQRITPEAHIAFAERFAAININRFFAALPEYPKIAQVLKEPSQKQNIGETWHTDHSYDQIPALGSILVARELPKTGGDTLFVNQFAAYDALDPALKKQLSTLTATHSSRHVFGEQAYRKNADDMTGRLGNASAATQDAVHPIIIKHPFSGRPALYVNPQFTIRINELDQQQSAELLQQLYTHSTNERFQHRFQWQPGSIAFWDNRATWHKALNDYAGYRRLMHRITIEGESLSG